MITTAEDAADMLDLLIEHIVVNSHSNLTETSEVLNVNYLTGSNDGQL